MKTEEETEKAQQQLFQRNEEWVKNTTDKIEREALMRIIDKKEINMKLNELWTTTRRQESRTDQLYVLGKQPTEMNQHNFKVIQDKLNEVLGVMATYQDMSSARLHLVEYNVRKCNNQNGQTNEALIHVGELANIAGITLPSPDEIIGMKRHTTIKPLQLVEGKLTDNRARRESSTSDELPELLNTHEAEKLIQSIHTEEKEVKR